MNSSMKGFAPEFSFSAAIVTLGGFMAPWPNQPLTPMTEQVLVGGLRGGMPLVANVPRRNESYRV